MNPADALYEAVLLLNGYSNLLSTYRPDLFEHLSREISDVINALGDVARELTAVEA